MIWYGFEICLRINLNSSKIDEILEKIFAKNVY